MVKEVKSKIDRILEYNKYAINKSDYRRLKAYIDLLYHFALPYSEYRNNRKR